jgi:hypothetical protein
MRMRFARGVVIASAMGLGLVMSGGAALAASPAPDAAPDAVTSPDVAVNWSLGKPSPFGGTRFDGARVGKLVYYLGFRLADNSTDGSIWTYNIETKNFKDTGIDMAVPVTNYTVAVLEDNTGLGLYTFGGRTADGETSTTVQVFYPATGQTKVISADPWPGTTPSECVSLPATGVSVVDNTAYVVGGMSFSTSIPACIDDQSNEVWRFKPKASAGNRWSAMPSLKVARGYIATAVDGDRIYAIGGDVNEAGTLVASPVVESWKIGGNKWNDTNYKDLPVGCDETQAFAFSGGDLGGTITLAGCGQWPNAIPDVYQYNIGTNKWSIVGTLNEARRNHAGENIGSASAPKLFVLGGYSGDASTVLMSSEIGRAGAAEVGHPAVPGVPVVGRPTAF